MVELKIQNNDNLSLSTTAQDANDALRAEISYWTLYRYGTKLEIAGLLCCSTLAAVGGAILPCLTILFGSLSSSFSKFTLGSISQTQGRQEVNRYSLYLFYFAIGEFLAIFISYALFSIIGERITNRIRECYLKALLRQNIAYFETVRAGEIGTRISSEMNLIQDGISEKVGIIITSVAAFVAALVISFLKSWKLSLIVLSTVVAMILAIGIGGKLVVKYRTNALMTETAASNVAEEAVGAMRTTTAFGAQTEMENRYQGHLDTVQKWSFRTRSSSGVLIGIVTAVLYMEHALSFWQGSRFLVSGEVSLAAIITITIALMMAGAFLSQMLPHLNAIPTALAAAKKVFETIDRQSSVDPFQINGKRLEKVQGQLEFCDVKFSYISRQEPVFENLSFNVPEGKMTALVGPSGCGKSTIISLIERFYLPDSGTITLDGHDISQLNVSWVRQNISLVSQEPILFAGTIFENIEAGLVGTKHEHDTQEMKLKLVTEAATVSNAHDFISSMPSGYMTEVGSKGSLLSGGQKQRIVIARAIISDPKILLLDEATSALDSKSESMVQKALEKASQGRTTVVIAHRMSTIRKADNIIVLNKGQILEQGTHFELMKHKNVYFNLVQRQSLNKKNEGEGEKNVFDETSDDEFSPPLDSTEVVLFQPLTNSASLQEKAANGTVVHITTSPHNTSIRDLVLFMWSLSRPERAVLLLGIFFSIISGGNQPVRGILFGHAVMALSQPSSQLAKIKHDSNFWSAMFLMLALVEMLALSGQGIAFAFSSERLVRRAQAKAFRSLMRQDIAFFDRKENSAGSLSVLLSNEASRLAGLSGATLGAIVVFLTTVIAAIGISLGYGWKLSLVCISVMPVLIASGFLRIWITAEYDKRVSRSTEAAAFAIEATSAIRTVASLTLEASILRRYRHLLVTETYQSTKFYIRSSAAFGVSQAIIFAASALGFWYGGNLIVDGEYTILSFFICFTEILFGAQAAGNIFSFAPELGSGRGAAERFKEIIEARPRIDTWSDSGKAIHDVQGKIEFKDVSFCYPERQSQVVLKNFNLTIEPEQFVALVGYSGCGKSTALNLVERFYDPSGGMIMLDGVDISSLNLVQYRRNFALVSQDTTLYTGTIKENLCLDLKDVQKSRLDKACADANILDFITSLPEGYHTLVGPKGNSLSGGQRQRLAIARAILRDPKILLLDEATSALDAVSEAVVEEALRRAAKGRTTIAIAHSLSSIYHADIIYVIEEGRVVEAGNHQQLMDIQGRYWKMAQLQNFGLVL